MRAILFFLAVNLAMGQTPADQPASPAQMTGVRTVYFLPLPNGLEQFVANQLVKRGVLSVVTDPELASAVFTDTLGSGFRERMEEIYPAPKPPVAVKAGEDGGTAKEEANEAAAKEKDSNVRRVSALARGKGTIFLVDRKTSLVLWSVYVRPRSSSPRDLDHAAKAIADRLAGWVNKSSGASR